MKNVKSRAASQKAILKRLGDLGSRGGGGGGTRGGAGGGTGGGKGGGAGG